MLKSFKLPHSSPTKLVCIGRNYVEHIQELNNEMPEHFNADNMVVFLKPNSALCDQLQSNLDEPLHYESELCFLYQDGQLSAVAFGLDITKRELQSQLKAKGLPWERAKAFDGAALLGNFVNIQDPDIKHLNLELRINGKLIQQGGVKSMMYPPQTIQKNLSSFMSLKNGDVIMTGTPKGVGVINKGDVFEGRVLLVNEMISTTTWTAL